MAQSWGAANLKAGDRILLTEMEHHSNIVPWQLLAERTGARLSFVPVTGDIGLLDLNRLDEVLTSEVKLFAMTHISNSLGTINPVVDLCARARKLGVTTLVDAAQSAGTPPRGRAGDWLRFPGPLRPQNVRPHGHRRALRRQEVLEPMPPWQGGGEMILSVEFQKSTLKHAPHKFEAGTPDISGAVGLHAAMDYLDHMGACASPT